MCFIACRRVAAMLLVGALLTPCVTAAPYLPRDDATVLERLPEGRDPSLAQLKRLRTALASRPRDTTLAVRLAERAIAAARASGDPRFLGQAQAALAPWWSEPDPPIDIAVLRATIRQSLHEFPAALADLDRVLARRPDYAQARLTRATILTVTGRYPEANADCASLARTTIPIVGATCRAGVASVDGHAAAAYAELAQVLARSERLDPAVLAWAHTLAGEIAARRGEAAEAETHFAAALGADPADAYLRGAYADFLIDRDRPREAAAIVGADLTNDALLLRAALAEARFDVPTADEQRSLARHREMLRARFDASRARGDVVHRREEARFVLALERDPQRALVLARANWEVQREPADLRILAEAAAAARDAGVLQIVRAWTRQHGLEDERVATIMGPAS